MEKPVVILKRPKNPNDTAVLNGNESNSKPKSHIKPLHQRQQEYAEARMRILGAKPDDDDE